jgi:hypothetical protein
MKFDFIGLSKVTFVPEVIFSIDNILYFATLPRIVFEDSKDLDGNINEDIFIKTLFENHKDKMKILNLEDAILKYPDSTIVKSLWRDYQINFLL